MLPIHMRELNADSSTWMATNHNAVRPDFFAIHEKTDGELAPWFLRHWSLKITAARTNIFYLAPDRKFLALCVQSGFDVTFQALLLSSALFRRSGGICLCMCFWLMVSAKGCLHQAKFAAQRGLPQPIQLVRPKPPVVALSSPGKLFPMCRLLAAFDGHDQSLHEASAVGQITPVRCTSVR